MAHVATRISEFRTSPTGAMSALVRRLKAEGKDIIGLVGGEPDFATPANVKEAGITAIRNNRTRYTNVDGTPALKQALSEKFKRENGLDYTPAQIVASSGTKPILHAALMAMTDPGDEVIVPAPPLGLPPRHRPASSAPCPSSSPARPTPVFGCSPRISRPRLRRAPAC